MDQKSYTLVRVIMHEYLAKGKKSDYRKKQMKRLGAILDEIMVREACTLTTISKKSIILYYIRHANETHQTLKEKHAILSIFFGKFKPSFKVPEPRADKCGKE